MAIEGRITKLGEAALHAEGDTWAVQQYRGLKAFGDQPTGLKQVHQADGPLEGNGVKGDQSLFARLSFDIGKNLLLIVNEKIAWLIRRTADSRHERWGDQIRPKHRPATASGNVAIATKVGLSMRLIRSPPLLCDWLRIQLDEPAMVKC